MLIHAAIHWPEKADLALWPFAMEHAVWIWNKLPKPDTGFSPEELFTKIKSEHDDLKRTHVWG